MLIVLGILVLLLAMVVPRFLGSQKRAKIDAAKTQIGMFRAALEHYYLDSTSSPPPNKDWRRWRPSRPISPRT